MKPTLPLLLALAVALAACATSSADSPEAATASPPPAPPASVTTTPVARSEPWWTTRHELLCQRAATGDPELLFVGDSITQGWEDAGREVWAAAYGDRAAVNLGIGGDRTQHVLWRLEHGNLPDGLDPELVVVMIGTNNAADDTPQQIADGVAAVARRLWIELPGTEVVVLAIFPRGEDRFDPLRKVNREANRLLKGLPEQFADGRVRVLYLGLEFLEPDDTLSRAVMPDLLHLSAEGYRRWARALEPVVAEALGDELREL